ncbi:glycosyl transferase, group 1 [Acidisarcina polymorpha]|uniref:Glycosyl transferase, group 1 n=1 Tax=Acidisarcina polymorpha TaxID=2211140 RepID=A0A2Z5FUF5_9BACT|nr:glycosyltransferase [Acidisarcina polymorpha]AXC10137.1 glycosyl transferase, group 1 [Acidisarcina polymorpha]
MRGKLGYLISRYPAISHTFILREVLELRRLGYHIEVASINQPDQPRSGLTLEERAEADSTFYVKSSGARGALQAQASELAHNPLAYMRGFIFAAALGGTDPRRAIMSILYFVEAVLIVQWMRARGLKHLHVHFATPAATVGLIVAKVSRFTFSLTIHGPDEFYDTPGYLLPEKIATANLLCVIGMFARSQVMRLCESSLWDKIELTPLGVDARLFRPTGLAKTAKIFEILCVGRLVPAKGQHVLLAAVARLRSSGRAVLLRLVGDGPDRSSLEASTRLLRIEDSVIFEGPVNQDRIRDLYATADVFVLASFAEGIPVVLMEAMAMEIPCVSTWVNGIPELIRDSIDGLLVSPSDADALAAAIARLMDDGDLRNQLAKAGRLRVIDKYDLTENVAHLAEVFDAYLCEEATSAPDHARSVLA